MALPHRSLFSHGPVLGTVIRIAYFLVVFSFIVAGVLYLRRIYIDGVETTFLEQLEWVRNDFEILWRETDGAYFKAVFVGLCIGAFSHTAADVIWSSLKRLR